MIFRARLQEDSAVWTLIEKESSNCGSSSRIISISPPATNTEVLATADSEPSLK